MQRFLFLGLLIFGVACKKGDSNPNTPAVEKTYTNISYGTNTAQKMDIYLPAGRDTVNTKLLVLIHGGAWIGGDKTDFVYSDIKKLLPGYAFASINYRLSDNGQNKFPAQEEDIQAAISYLLSKQADYQYSNKIVLLGASAGGQLALLQGYKYAKMIVPKAIISFFGPTDLTWLYNHPDNAAFPPMLAAIVGATPSQNPSIYTSSSPINFVSAQSPPTLLLQGDADILVPVDQATRLNDKLQTAGVTHQLIIYPGEVHGFSATAMSDAYTKVVSFLNANVK
jgi:acetyl esterase/lipase